MDLAILSSRTTPLSSQTLLEFAEILRELADMQVKGEVKDVESVLEV